MLSRSRSLGRGSVPAVGAVMGTSPFPAAGELCETFAGVKHARFHDPNVVYHVLLRTFQGRFLLRPDRRGVLNDMIAGVVGRAQERWPNVQLYAHAWLSNHAHILARGSPDDLPQFIGFIERELSRRWGHHIAWPDRMWQRYESTALVGPDSELRAFRYVLAQGTKEHLVDHPLKWPGVHCAKDLVDGNTRKGTWFDGTGYGRARHAQRCCLRPKPVARRDFVLTYSIVLNRLPSCRGMSDDQYRSFVGDLVAETARSAAREREMSGKSVVGRRRILSTSRERRSELPAPPWYEGRRRMVVWADRLAHGTRTYLRRYWEFQRKFRESSKRFCSGEVTAPFPTSAFRPSVFVH